MYFGLVHYPQVLHDGFQSFRRKYDPFYDLVPEHITFIHPVPESVGRERLEDHIEKVLSGWHPFKVHFCTLEKNWDHWLYLGAKEGHDSVVELHDKLYDGILRPYLREDLPFYPHIGLGLFSMESYDFDNPTVQLTLDSEKYHSASEEFENLGFDLWCTIDRLTLLTISSDYKVCTDLRDFRINTSIAS